MKINGYKIMDALEVFKEKAQLLDSNFIGSIFTFEDEDKPDPVKLMSEYEEIESKIVKLQELQSRYNLTVKIEFEGDQITLEKAIKLLGVMGRLKNQWQAAAKLEPGKGQSHRQYFMDDCNDFTRHKDIQVPDRRVSREKSEELADKYAKLSQKLKQLVRSGNAQELDMDIDPASFEL